jgi:hypothetical protein
MNITFSCPACQRPVAVAGVEERQSLDCPACHAAVSVSADAVSSPRPGETIRPLRCLICACPELFVRKNFPQRLGVGIVVAGFAASCVAWAFRELTLTFAILFATALLDVVLYVVMPECLTCYRCGARYTGPGVTSRYGAFDLEVHERHRQMAARSRAAASERASHAVGG